MVTPGILRSKNMQAMRKEAQGASPCAPVDHVEKPKISRGKSKNTQT